MSSFRVIHDSTLVYKFAIARLRTICQIATICFMTAGQQATLQIEILPLPNRHETAVTNQFFIFLSIDDSIFYDSAFCVFLARPRSESHHKFTGKFMQKAN